MRAAIILFLFAVAVATAAAWFAAPTLDAMARIALPMAAALWFAYVMVAALRGAKTIAAGR